MSVRCQIYPIDGYVLLACCLFHRLGLFAPRLSHQYRDEQQRRRPQFDRGSVAAESEVVYVREYSPQRYRGVDNDLRSAKYDYPAMGMLYDHRRDVSDTGSKTS